MAYRFELMNVQPRSSSPLSAQRREVFPRAGDGSWGRAARSSGAGARVAGAILLGVVGLLGLGCGDTEETRVLEPRLVAVSEADTPIYDDGEITIFESKIGIQFPMRAPTGEQRGRLHRTAVEPYPHHPWVEVDALEVQVSWVVSNLDPEPHSVGILIDPWNEFGRYWPGLSLIDADNGEYLPNLSGYDRFIEVPGTNSGQASRVSGTATFEDMREMAIDFATVMQLIATPPTNTGAVQDDGNLLAVYANHAFHKQNRSGSSPLVDPYRPQVIAGLTGIDVGVRTLEPANVALEVIVEIVRVNDDSPVATKDQEQEVPLLPIPDQYITVGAGP